MKADLVLKFADGTHTEPPQYGVINVGPMQLHLSGAAGGGWGDPLERDVALVLRDVKDGVVSARCAREEYGVVIDLASSSVDTAATGALRATLRNSGTSADLRP